MKKKTVFFLTFFLLLLLTISTAYAEWEKKDYVTFMGYTSENVTVAWDAASNATGYDYRLFHVERQSYIMQGSTANTQVTFQLPKSGHYIIEVRSKNDTEQSEWVLSTDATYATIDNQAGAWWIYGHVEPVGPIIIN